MNIIVGSWKNSKRSSKYLLFFYKKCRKIIYVLVKVTGIFYNSDGDAGKTGRFTSYNQGKYGGNGKWKSYVWT